MFRKHETFTLILFATRPYSTDYTPPRNFRHINRAAASDFHCGGASQFILLFLSCLRTQRLASSIL